MTDEQTRDKPTPGGPSLPTPGEAEGTSYSGDVSAPAGPSLPTPGEAEGDRATVEADERRQEERRAP